VRSETDGATSSHFQVAAGYSYTVIKEDNDLLSALIKVNKKNEKPLHINSAGLMHVELIDCEDN
jgi:hypothetical protein